MGPLVPTMTSVQAFRTSKRGSLDPVGEDRRCSNVRSMETFVYDFAVGNMGQKDLLGGKGANLAEMTRMGLPVPPGFTVSTEACRAYLAAGDSPDGLDDQVGAHLAALEGLMGRRLSDPQDPLLVSVRSGAKFSMPGMMETVLDVGLNDASVHGLAQQSGSARFAWDSYRRLVQMFGSTVLGIDAHLFATELEHLKVARGAAQDVDLTVEDLQSLLTIYRELVEKETGQQFPQDPRDQLDLAIRAVFDSWHTDRARIYRRQEQIPEDLGTAVNIQVMVFGNSGATSGSGVCFTRDPATGRRGVYGDYLSDAQGEDVVAGIRNTVPLTDLGHLDPTSYAQLLDVMATLEGHYHDLCDIEFTIERGRLWVLQTRVGKRTAEAAFRIAADMVAEKAIDLDEALRRVTGDQLGTLMFPRFDPAGSRHLIARGINASPGAAVGRVVFDSASAVAWAARGDDVILVREETDPDDLPGLIAAKGVLTSRGGRTSHAAVVARGLGRTCVCGADDLDVDLAAREFTVRSTATTLREGDLISLDGASGEVFAGAVPVVDSPVVRWFEGGPIEDDLVAAVALITQHADRRRRLGVRANADTPQDAARARRFGASGIGLCRTEHMFLGERRQFVERLIVARDPSSQEEALTALLPLQQDDFIGILAAMDGLPVTVRLLDPPLHEFLPDLTELSVRVAVADERGLVNEHDVRLLGAVRRLHEQNPMLGLRGVRLGLVVPGLFATQTRALLLAAADRLASGGDPQVEIMVPLVASVHELEIIRAELEAVHADVEAEVGRQIRCQIGTMIEVPRAALTAAKIAACADFFSYGTNDLTQMTWGFSRDDVEGSFFTEYLEHAIFPVSPFESIDIEGVGALIRHATREGRLANPALRIGVCGEHGGDPRSIHFFDQVGLDYVSCSPFRVPVARLEAGRAALTEV
jgi:pyruvate,orthophosphate dikinase